MNSSQQTPDGIRQQIWKELVRATRDRHHAWRTPVLATAMRDGAVNARTVVLRKAVLAETGGLLEIYTDQRSAKVGELIVQPSACLVFWSSRLNWQLRIRADVTIRNDGPYVESLWQSLKQTRAARDYMSLRSPGMALVQTCDDAERNVLKNEAPKTYFSVLTARVLDIDWLELGREQHRRAKITGDQFLWLEP